MEAEQILKQAAQASASDIFIVAGLPVSYKVNNQIQRQTDQRLMPEDTEVIVRELYRFAKRSPEKMLETGDDDFSFSLEGVSRYRASVYRQRGSLAAVVRVIAFSLPDPEQLGIPDIILRLGGRPKGLIVVTGPAGSGKSTTLACIIDRINQTRNSHVVTLEDPIEYLHRHGKSIISQREISIDTESYAVALRAALRQAPDVILLGEMRDYETISIAMTAAETGHLVISTLHTLGAVNTIDRIVDAFPPSQQGQIRVQLSMVLQAVVVAIPEKGTMASTKEVGLCVSLWIEFHEIKSVVCAIRCKRYIMIFCHGMLKGNHMFLVDNFTRRLMLVICVFGFQWWKGNSTAGNHSWSGRM